MPPDPSEPISSQLMYTSETFVDPFANSGLARKRSKGQAVASLRLSAQRSSIQVDPADSLIAFPTLTPELTPHGVVETPLPTSTPIMSATHRARRASAAEKVLEQLRSRDMQKSGSAMLSNPRTSWLNFQHHEPLPAMATTTHTTAVGTTASSTATTTTLNTGVNVSTTPNTNVTTFSVHESPRKARPDARRLSLTTPAVPPPSPVLSKATINPSWHSRPSRSSSIIQPTAQLAVGPAPSSGITVSQPVIPPSLIPLLDGDHHTDELSVRFEAGWPLLEQWLIAIGDGEGDGDYGRVTIIYK